MIAVVVIVAAIPATVLRVAVVVLAGIMTEASLAVVAVVFLALIEEVCVIVEVSAIASEDSEPLFPFAGETEEPVEQTIGQQQFERLQICT